MLPEWLPSKWLMLFTQPWEGDVTMILPAELWLLGKTIVNPTTEELLRSVKVGACRLRLNLAVVCPNSALIW